MIFVGGFLAAGKTTTIAAAVRLLVARGVRAAAITNDQAAGLVDTDTLRDAGAAVAEVGSGCFCCRFSDLVAAADSLLAASPDVLFCEAVGSCTDLVATVAEPFARFYGGAVDVAPVSVVVDPLRFAARADDDVDYLYGQQIDEADIIVINKTDLATPAQREAIARACGDRDRVEVSALRGEGIEAWLDVLDRGDSCRHPLHTLDYDRYAHGESLLAWLNATGTIVTPHDPRVVAERLIGLLTPTGVAHVKLRVGGVRAHASPACPAVVFGEGSAAAASRVVINVRARTDALELRELVGQALRIVQARVETLQAFHPAYPHPENANPYLEGRA